jgi:hypothetical protein
MVVKESTATWLKATLFSNVYRYSGINHKRATGWLAGRFMDMPNIRCLVTPEGILCNVGGVIADPL